MSLGQKGLNTVEGVFISKRRVLDEQPKHDLDYIPIINLFQPIMSNKICWRLTRLRPCEPSSIHSYILGSVYQRSALSECSFYQLPWILNQIYSLLNTTGHFWPTPKVYPSPTFNDSQGNTIHFVAVWGGNFNQALYEEFRLNCSCTC